MRGVFIDRLRCTSRHVLREVAISLSAHFLRGVHRRVSVLDELAGFLAVSRKTGNSYARCHGDAQTIKLMRLCKVGDDLLCQRVQCCNIGCSMNKQNKLISTEATNNHIVFAAELLQPSGSGMKQIVTYLVTETIIYAAEVVQIHE